MAGNATTKVKFYVTTVAECPACEGVGGIGAKPCTDCSATGTIDDATELSDALAALGILPALSRWSAPPAGRPTRATPC